jgi:hypothetical protein
MESDIPDNDIPSHESLHKLTVPLILPIFCSQLNPPIIAPESNNAVCASLTSKHTTAVVYAARCYTLWLI